jgi:cold shock CspA family protein
MASNGSVNYYIVEGYEVVFATAEGPKGPMAVSVKKLN